MKKFIQKNSPHPGEILLEFYFEPLGLTITEAARKLLIARPNLSAIVNGKMGISPLMALKLAKAFNTTPNFWLNMQANYDISYVSRHDESVGKIKVLV